MEKLLKKLRKDFPAINFASAKKFCWSPAQSEVSYRIDEENEEVGRWSLLHELAHGVLNHQSYDTDIGLLRLEVAAWDKATIIGKKYDVVIDNEHIQDCLDTYRDWLDSRSTCPDCLQNGIQVNSSEYRCVNCPLRWRVTSSRFARPYRLKTSNQIKTSPVSKETKATFL